MTRSCERICGCIAALVMLSGCMPAAQAPASAARPAPCHIGAGLAVYLVFGGQRHAIPDLFSFENLGYHQQDIVQCGAAASLPEGPTLTRLATGPGYPITLFDAGKRRHVLPSGDALSFWPGGVSGMPGEMLGLWPEGDPIGPETPAGGWLLDLYYPWAHYTLHLGRFAPQLYAFTDLTISAPGQAPARVASVRDIDETAVRDLTGDGYEDLIIQSTKGTVRCCDGTLVYQLGPTLTPVLIDYQDIQHGHFEDLDGDGRYEYLTDDIAGLGGSCPYHVDTVLSYDPRVHRYVGASPRFPGYFAPRIAALKAASKPGLDCGRIPLVAQLYYIGRVDEAKAEFGRLYTAPDADQVWASLVTMVSHFTYYVPPG